MPPMVLNPGIGENQARIELPRIKVYGYEEVL
jgi:hypothetical protein